MRMREEGFNTNEGWFPTGMGQPNWGFIGRGFEPFPRPDEYPRPTTWWLLIYAVRSALRTMYRQFRKIWQKIFDGGHREAT
jgi:hypothetical protein